LDGITVDFSGSLSDKERLKLRKRRGRLHAMEESVIDATTAIRKLAAPSGIAWVNVRYAFVDTGVPVSIQRRGDPSDRRLPDKEDRPPATRIMSPAERRSASSLPRCSRCRRGSARATGSPW
jgi:hypothetical protein